MRRGPIVVDPAHVLSPEGLRVAAWLAFPEIIGPFYLAGGTGLALQLGHRVSVDFDWFSGTNQLQEADRQRLFAGLRAAVPLSHDVTVLREEVGTLAVRVGGVDVSFFAYPYPLLEPATMQRGLPLASYADIGAMKLAAIVGRGSRKDFIDVHALMQVQPLDVWLQAATRKFAHVTDFRLSALRALVYFADADAEAPPRTLTPVDWSGVKDELVAAVHAIARRDLGLQPGRSPGPSPGPSP